MISSRKWYSPLLTTLALLLTIQLAACAPSETQSSSTLPPPPATAPPTTAPLSSPQTTPIPTAIPASEAKRHIGERTTVYGVVVSPTYASGSRGRPTFLNLDKPYPNQIFTVVIWGEHRGNFPEPPEILYKGKTIYVTGLIFDYKGVPEIEVTSPNQIQVR